MKKYGITFRFIADLVGKKEEAVKMYFHRKGWSISSVENVREYLRKNIYY